MSEAQKVKVFISWSGPLSKGVAGALRVWLPEVFDNIDPWMSDHDIEAGQRGLEEIEGALVGSRFGIVVVTRSNQESQWLNFEAGALSKTITDQAKQRVVPLLVDIEKTSQVTGPIAQFQMKMLDKDGMRGLMISLGTMLGVELEKISVKLDRNWAALEEAVEAARSVAEEVEAAPEKPERGTSDMFDEILTHIRALRNEAIYAMPSRSASSALRFRHPSIRAEAEQAQRDNVIRSIGNFVAARFDSSVVSVRFEEATLGEPGRVTVVVPLSFPSSKTSELAQELAAEVGEQVAVTYPSPRRNRAAENQAMLDEIMETGGEVPRD